MDRIVFQRMINAHPRDRGPQLVYADWLEEHGDPQAAYWRGHNADSFLGRGGRFDLGGHVSRSGRGGLVGRSGLVGRGGLGGFGHLAPLGGVGGSLAGIGVGDLARIGGVGGLAGLGSVVGLVGPVRFGYLIGLLQPENQIMLIPGENAVVFIPNGYGFSVFVGHVASEHAHGWIVNPCREVLETGCQDRWVEFAAGKPKDIRARAKFGPPILGGARVPFGCMSLLWHGELPE